MARFEFRLATLLRLREAARDERRGQLAVALRAEEVLRQRDNQVRDEVDQLRESLKRDSLFGSLDVEKLINSHRYGALLEAERTMIGQQSRQVAEEIDKRRAVLVDADRDVQVLEKLRENQSRLHRRHQERLEMKVMDEIAGRTRNVEENR